MGDTFGTHAEKDTFIGYLLRPGGRGCYKHPLGAGKRSTGVAINSKLGIYSMFSPLIHCSLLYQYLREQNIVGIISVIYTCSAYSENNQNSYKSCWYKHAKNCIVKKCLTIIIISIICRGEKFWLVDTPFANYMFSFPHMYFYLYF
jgi:hypothetical protein